MKNDGFLRQLLGPVELEQFLQVYLERQSLHVSGRQSSHFHPLVSIPRIERLLSSAALFFPGTQLMRSGQSIAVEDYTDDESRIVPKRLAQHHADGATIVMSHAHRLFASLNDVCRSLQSHLKVRCQTNVYLSPPGSQGFNPHYDSHDVFILQIVGSKSFRFYEGGPALPMSHQRFDASTSEVGRQSEEIVLQAGDTLYIPRGVMHDAVAEGSGPSLHVTLGIFAITVYEVMQEVLRSAAENDVELRKSLVGQAWEGLRGERLVAASSLTHLLDMACTEGNLSAAMSRLEDDLAIDGVPDCESLLSDQAHRVVLTLDSWVRLREGIVLNVERRSTSLKVRSPGQVLEFRAPLSLAVESLLANTCQKIGELPGVTDEQRLDLCHALQREQVIEPVVNPTSAISV